MCLSSFEVLLNDHCLLSFYTLDELFSYDFYLDPISYLTYFLLLKFFTEPSTALVPELLRVQLL